MNSNKDMVMMKGGQMIMLINGQMYLMDGKVTTTDGSQVQKDGTVILPDGTTRMLQEDEAMIIDLLSSRIGNW